MNMCGKCGRRFFSDREEAMVHKIEVEEKRLRRLSAMLEPAEKTEFVHMYAGSSRRVRGCRKGAVGFASVQTVPCVDSP